MKRLLIFLLLPISACLKPGYFDTNKKVMDHLYQGTYNKALDDLEKNKYLKEEFNQTLYQVEKGRLLFLAGNYDEAAKILIEAEKAQDDWKSFFYRDISGNKVKAFGNLYTADGKPAQAVTGQQQSQNLYGSSGSLTTPSLLSPARTQYFCSDFEKPLVDFYVGLCGVFLKDDKPGVEARRLDLLSQKLDNRKWPMRVSGTGYSSNPFIALSEGFFYEQSGDINNALISYERALADYQDPFCRLNYGVSLPEQLKLDVVRLSEQMGFTDRAADYRKKFGMSKDAGKEKHLSTVILIVERGFVPVKQIMPVYYYIQNPGDRIEGPVSAKPSGASGWTKTTTVSVKETCTGGGIRKVVCNRNQARGSVINDLRYMMADIMANRIQQELMEERSILIVKSGAKSTSIKNYDTRNWQSLPSEISYFRIPLQTGSNEIQLEYETSAKQIKTHLIKVTGQPGTQLKYVWLQP